VVDVAVVVCGDRRWVLENDKHGGCLDITEVGLSVFTKQYLNLRIPDLEILRREATAWVQ